MKKNVILLSAVFAIALSVTLLFSKTEANVVSIDETEAIACLNEPLIESEEDSFLACPGGGYPIYCPMIKRRVCPDDCF